MNCFWYDENKENVGGDTMFATAAMGVVFLAPLALLALFVFMLKSNRTILSLVPLALLIVFLIFNYNEFMQMVVVEGGNQHHKRRNRKGEYRQISFRRDR